MQLPSERIKELSKVTNIIGGQDIVTHDFLWGIIAYLDEQYEQHKPCESHKLVLNARGAIGRITASESEQKISVTASVEDIAH